MGNAPPTAGAGGGQGQHHGYPNNAGGYAQASGGYATPANFHGQQQQQNDRQAGGMPRSSSDASMTIVDNDTMQQTIQQQHQGQQVQQQQIASIENLLDDDTVPTVFRWEHGGRQVYITGTFNCWSRQIPMHRSGNDFTYIHNLTRTKHAFKFIVDDEWRFAPDQPTVADIEGRINNFIDVTGFKPYTGDKDFEKEKAAAAYGGSSIDDTATGTLPTSNSVATPSTDVATDTGSTSTKPDQDGEVFSSTMPDLDDYTKEPPPLPPHLRHIILNKPPQLQDTAALPVPQHVALNHLYCTAIKDNMMVLGITQRYKTKFVTTVYYSPCASK